MYEGRDAFYQEASSFERAQIVRLDSRQIAMLRYYLGSCYEDVFIPVSILSGLCGTRGIILIVLFTNRARGIRPRTTGIRCKFETQVSSRRVSMLGSRGLTIAFSSQAFARIRGSCN